ncbi:winged helix-turn-helix domain-containing protein [Pseudoalteromonas sp. C2R02]|uniref:winged helix-turn-helix domain-containing protein n=1 Tax=Pseudoalteromonas sp. C2R02 TaxID=2841565 RepID=UPI001C08D8A9|nr:winged helix-turn-helix domain-containing protein [Pseudoalteromonas sp. C2R02]MBU2970432.1 winged helix-turn-helix domain-containing protein [Pseudoalteromonas sp. C2R02]
MIDFEQSFSIETFIVNPKMDTLSYQGQTVEVQSMGMKVLCYLATHQDKVISRDDLREHVWQNTTASNHTINNYIYSLRRIFSKFDPDTKYIHTVTGGKGNGYRLIAKIEQIQGSESTYAEVVSSNTPAVKSLFNKINIFKLLLIALITITLLFFYLSDYNINTDYNNVTVLTKQIGREQSPAVSDDGTLLLYANRKNRDKYWTLYASHTNNLDKAVKVFDKQNTSENFVSISPNNKYIAFMRYKSNHSGIYIADFNPQTLKAHNPKLIIRLQKGNFTPSISWLNNRQFYYNMKEAETAPRKFYLYDLVLNTSEQISAPPINTNGDFAGTISPDKKLFAIMRSNKDLGFEVHLLNIQTNDLTPTPIKINEKRVNISFSDDNKAIYFIDNKGYLSQFNISTSEISRITSLAYAGYWPLKVPGKEQFIMQQDWGLSSLTTRIIKHSNPLKGGDGKSKVVLENGMSIRSIAKVEDGLLFASIKPNHQIELWRLNDKSAKKLTQFNEKTEYTYPLSINWLQGSEKAVLSINNSCRLININTGKDIPLCPDGENVYSARFSNVSDDIYLAGTKFDQPYAVRMGSSGFPLKSLDALADVNLIIQDSQDIFYYSEYDTYDIYRYNSKTATKEKLITRTYLNNPYSTNDFVVTQTGIYFMDRVAVRNNAIYFYDFEKKTTQFVIPSKDNYPNLVLSDDESEIFLIQSYDNDTNLILVE